MDGHPKNQRQTPLEGSNIAHKGATLLPSTMNVGHKAQDPNGKGIFLSGRRYESNTSGVRSSILVCPLACST